jgi:hypothetical protein
MAYESNKARLNYKFSSGSIRRKFKIHCSILGISMQDRVTKLILDDLKKLQIMLPKTEIKNNRRGGAG